MILQLLLVLFLGFIFSFFFNYASYFSADFHHFCLGSSPQSSYRELYQAIVCGQKLDSGEFLTPLKQLGVIHIVVVSGAHLLFLSQLLELITFKKSPKILNLIILLLFVACCQFQIPALRAWIYLCLKLIDKKLKLFNSQPFTILLSALFCLSLNLELFYSVSIPLSWLASLCIFMGKNTFTRALLCYITLAPILFAFQVLHPWSIIINSFFIPIICFLLFPLSLLSFFTSITIPLADSLWELLFFMSDKISPDITSLSSATKSLPPLALWLYPTTINLWLIFNEVRRNHV